MLAIAITCALSLDAQRAVLDKVVATVGSELVLLSDLEEQYALISAQSGVLPPDARCEILDNIMSGKLLLNQAKLDSVEVADNEVEDQLNARIDRILAYMNGDVTQFEDYYGQSITEVKAQFREDLRNQLLTDRMRGRVMTGATATPAEVRAFFSDIPRDSLPYFNAEVEVAEIVYKPRVNPVERQKAIDRLTEVRRLITEEGQDFAELAKKFSDDGSARSGGDLGWARRGKFVPAFEAAAYKLDKNEISPVVESEFGFHIIQMLERRGNSIHTRHILVRADITDDDLALAVHKLDSVRLLILKDSMTFQDAVRLFSDKDVQSYNNSGRMVNPETGNTFFEIGDLDPDIYFAIDSIKLINGISRPFAFSDPMGATYYRMVQLQSRTAPHRANLAQDYSKIQEATVRAKQSKFVDKWVQDRIEATYVQLDASYEGCPNLQKWTKKKPKP